MAGDISAGQAFLQIIPTLAGDKASIQRQLDQAAGGVGTKVPVKPEVDTAAMAEARAEVEALSTQVEEANARQAASTKELTAAEKALDDLRAQATAKGSQEVAQGEAQVAAARQVAQLASQRLAEAENNEATSEEELAQRRESVTRTTAAASAAEENLASVKTRLRASDADIATAETRVSEARSASSHATEEARSLTEDLTSAQGRLDRATKDAAEDAGKGKVDLDKLGESAKTAGTKADSAAKSVLDFSGKLRTGSQSLLMWGFAAPGAVQGTLSLTSALLPAVGALGLLPALGVAGGAALATLKIGTSGFGAAIKDAGTPKFAQDLAKLAPSARDTAQAIASLKPPMDSLKSSIQQALFADMAKDVKNLGGIYLPMLKNALVPIATGFNQIEGETAGWLQTSFGINTVRTLLDNTKTSVTNVLGAVAPLITSFITIGSIGSGVLAQLSTNVGGMAGKFAAWVGSAQGINTIRSMIEQAVTVIKTLGQIVGNVGSILLDVLRAASQAGANTLDVLRDLTGGIASFLRSADGARFLTTVFDNIHAALEAIRPLVSAVGQGLVQVLPTVSGALVDVGRAFASLAPLIPQIVGLIKQAAPVAGQLAGVIAGALTGAVRTLVPIFSGLISVLGGVMPFLSAIAPVLGPAALAAYGLVKGFQGVVGAVKGINDGIEAITKFSKAVKDAEIGTKLLAAAEAIWEGIQWALNAAMDANPIGLVVLAVGALVVAVIYAYNHFSTFRDIVNGCWEWLKSSTAAVGAFFVGIWNGIVSFFTGVWNGIRDVAMTVWNAVAGWFEAMFHVHYALWMQIWGAISGFFSAVWNGIRDVAVTVWNAISSYFAAQLAGYEAFWGAVWNGISSFFSMIWNAIRNTAVTVWNDIVAFLQPAINTFSAFFSSVWNGVSSFFSMIWNAIKTVAVDAWNGIVAFFTPALNAFASFFGSVWQGISDFLGRIWNGIRDTATSVWNGIVAVIKGAVNGVIDAANFMIHGVDAVLKFLLIPVIPDIPKMAAGGMVPMYAAGTSNIGGGFSTNRPTAIVGEGGPHPEYVIPTDPKYRGRATALHAQAGAALGVPMMADGGIVGDIGGWLGDAANWVSDTASSAWSGLTGALGDITQWLGDGFGALENQAKSAMNSLMPPGIFHGVGNWLVDKAFPAIQQKIMTTFASTSGGAAAPGQVKAWILEALALLGLPAGLEPGVANIVMHESSGNPTAINLTDSNARAGHPSQGLMQTIPSTFASYVLPQLAGLGIDNPIANLTAGIRYALANYGMAWLAGGGNRSSGGGYLGYDSGGYLPPGLTTVFNGTGRPEPVLTPSQLNAVASGGIGAGGGSFVGTLTLDNGAFVGQVQGVINDSNRSAAMALSSGPNNV